MALINKDSRQPHIISLSKRLHEIASARLELLLQLADLDARASAAQEERNALQTLDAPISYLPNDVLKMIFEEGMHPRDFSHHIGELVSHVTKRWRSVALDTPKLWNKVWCINNGRSSPYPIELPPFFPGQGHHL